MTRLRMAVVGVGHLGKEHARILADLPEVELVGVADVMAEQVEAVATRVGCKAYTNYRSLLQLVDAAVIAVPTCHHHAVASDFLRCGIPVLVEKPLALDVEEAEELVDIAHRQGTILQVGHIERFNPAYESLLGRSFQPKFIECQRLAGFTGRSADVSIVLDLMIHDLDLVLNLVGSPVRAVQAMGVSIFGGPEDVADARVTFVNGCVAHFAASRASYVAQRSMHIWAPEGFLSLDFAKKQLTLVQPSENVRAYGLDPRKLDRASFARIKDDLFGKHLETLSLDCNSGPDGLTRELKHFADCVVRGRRPRISGQEGRDAIALADRILASLRAHPWEGHPAGATGPMDLPRPLGKLFHPASDAAAA